MGWELTIYGDASRPPRPVGTREEVCGHLSARLTGLRLAPQPRVFADHMKGRVQDLGLSYTPTLEGYYEAPDFVLEFSCPDTETISDIFVNVRGSGNPLPVLRGLCAGTSWVVVEDASGDHILNASGHSKRWDWFSRLRYWAISKHSSRAKSNAKLSGGTERDGRVVFGFQSSLESRRRGRAFAYTMNAQISRIFLMVFLVLLVLSAGLLSVAGNNWPWFTVMGGCALVAAVAGRKWDRLAGIAAATLSVVLIISDIAAGAQYRKRFERFRSHPPVVAATNDEPGDPANGIQSIRSETNRTSSTDGSRR
jgi:hypothetical protein